MTETTGILFAFALLSLGILFFIINFINSFRSYRQIKTYTQTMEELYRNSEIDRQNLSTDQSKSIRDLIETVESLEKKIDELRLQTGIINARMGDYGSVISIPHMALHRQEQVRGKPGWPAGKPRKPKELPAQK